MPGGPTLNRKGSISTLTPVIVARHVHGKAALMCSEWPTRPASIASAASTVSPRKGWVWTCALNFWLDWDSWQEATVDEKSPGILSSHADRGTK